MNKNKFFLLIINIAFISCICPEVYPMDNLNLTEYIKKPWYIQKQQITSYLKIEDNYCVKAEYKISNKSVPFYSDLVLDVYNYANKYKVNGIDLNKNNNTLCARIPNKYNRSKLLVAPCFLPNIFAGDYWILDAGPLSNNYEWAIISGGQPKVKYSDGCTTNLNSINNAGFWYFTRAKIPPQKIIKKMDNISINLGFTLSQLNNLEQKNCNYN